MPNRPPDKYEALRQKYPEFAHHSVDQLENDPELMERLIRKMFTLSFTHHRYLKFFRKQTKRWNKGDYITFPGNKQFEQYGKREMLDERVIRNHLLGKHVFGVCFKDPFDTGDVATNFAIYDIDMVDADVAEQVAIALYNALKAEGIPCHISFSGGKGYHIEVHLIRKVLAEAVHDFLDYVVEKHRIDKLYAYLPKPKTTDNQIESRPTRTAGQGVKMSLGFHAKSDLFCGYLHMEGDHLVEVDDSYRYFLDIPFNASPDLFEAIHKENVRLKKEQQARDAEERMQKALLRRQKRTKSSNITSEGNDTKAAIAEAKMRYHDGEHDTWLEMGTEAPRRIAQEILEKGLYPGLKRHDTAFLLMRCLLFDHSKQETLQMVVDWTDTVLYPQCGHLISTPKEEHTRDMETLIESVQAIPFKNVSISKCELDGLVARCVNPNYNSLNLMKLKVLFGLYQCWKLNVLRASCKSDESPSAEFQASTRYVTKLVGVTIATYQKWRDELDDEGTVSLLDRGQPAPKEKKDERRMATYRMNMTPDVCGDTYTCHIWALSHKHFLEFLLGYFYANEELYQLMGGRKHYKRYRRLMSVIERLRFGGHSSTEV